MATPTDDTGNAPIEGSALYDPAEDEIIRQVIQARLAKLSPEEGRKWRKRMLAFLTQEEIVPIQKPEGNRERG